MVEVAPSIKSMLTHVQGVLQVLLQVCHVYGLDHQTEITAETVGHWTVMSLESGSWIKAAKYKLASFFAVHTNQKTLPSKPFEVEDNPAFLFGGKIGRWMRTYLKTTSPLMRMSFLQSILQSKKGMARPTEKEVKADVEKTYIHLTTKPKEQGMGKLLTDWAKADRLCTVGIEVWLNEANVKHELRRTVQELFPKDKTNFTMRDRFKPFFPSTSANYINNRKNAGAIGTILDHPELLKGLRKSGGHLKLKNTELDKVIESEYEIKGDDIELESKEFEDCWETLWRRMLVEAQAEIPVINLVGLAEPLKIRTISKHQPMIQCVLRSFWKFVHTRLRHHKTFKLIGTPQCEEQVLNAMGRKLEDNEAFLSGDYANATNELRSFVSNEIASALSVQMGLSEDESEILLKALTAQLLEDEKGVVKVQETGQSMGSIASFPILCIANAALTRWAIEVTEEKRKRLDQCNMAINGDDIAARSEMNLYHYWRQITSFGGLNESIGKTFVSREFVNINSTNYLYEQESHPITCQKPDGTSIERECPFREVPYFNLGLVFGLKRSNGPASLNDEADPRQNMGTRFRQMLKLCPDQIKAQAYNMAISHHRHILEKTRVPWFMPEWIGGLGLPITEDHQPSELDLRLGRRILLNWKKKQPIQMTHPETPWYTRKIAERLLPKPVWVSQKGPNTELFERIVGTKCIDLIFNSDIQLKDIFMETKGQAKMGRVFKHNSKLWKPKPGSLPEPLTLDEIMYKGRYAAYQTKELPIPVDLLIYNESNSHPEQHEHTDLLFLTEAEVNLQNFGENISKRLNLN